MSTITVAEILHDKARQSHRQALFTVAPELPIADAVSMMVNNAISSVIVMSPAEEEMQGLITLRELLKALNAHSGAVMQAPCKTAMKINPPVAKPDDSIDHLRGLMTELHITHVPVVDHGKLIGILSFHDIARTVIKDAAFENQLLKQYIKNWPE